MLQSKLWRAGAAAFADLHRRLTALDGRCESGVKPEDEFVARDALSPTVRSPEFVEDKFRPWIIAKSAITGMKISHPCFETPRSRTVKTERGEKIAVEVGDYFRRVDGRIDEWLFSAAPIERRSELRAFQTPRFHRTMSEWLNQVIDAGFNIERVNEPYPSDAAVRARARLARARGVADFFHLRAKKPQPG